MAKEPAAGGSPDTDEGGPVKSFLEHLEDLRWALIKSASTVCVGVLICLLAGPQVVAILMRPLEKAVISYPGTNQVVTFFLGANRLTTITFDPAQEELYNLDPGRHSPLFIPVDIVDLNSFAAKLQKPPKKDGVSPFLAGQLSPETRGLLAKYDPGTTGFLRQLTSFFRHDRPSDSAATAADNLLRQSFTDDLNRIIQAGPIHEPQRFAGVKPLPAAVALLAQNPQGSNLVRLNQQMLLSAYPRELSKEHERFYVLDVVPVPGSNGTRLLGFQVNTNMDAAAVAQHMKTSVNAFGPAKAFLVGFHVAIYAGIALASPFVLFFIGQFVLPALRIREKKYLYRGLGFAIPLFLAGVSFCYFVLMPAALAASQKYSDWFGFSSSFWDAGDYIGFVCKFMLGMGLGFELPVVILVLVKIGLLSYSSLSKARPYMVIINLILGAVLTTPEVFTQVLMAVPLQLLFELSVWIAWYWERQEKKNRRRPAAVKRLEA